MTSLPDFAAYGYQVTKELGHNLEGGRFTYLAKRPADGHSVVKSQFSYHCVSDNGYSKYKSLSALPIARRSSQLHRDPFLVI
ncbi:MAG: hypothetical protein ACK456_13135 [Pseudanabaenaceae cyanobacterium]|jgi:hypothetical protein